MFGSHYNRTEKWAGGLYVDHSHGEDTLAVWTKKYDFFILFVNLLIIDLGKLIIILINLEFFFMEMFAGIETL